MTQSIAVLVVIPARGGSKGIPRKNLRALAGRPLIAHVIETVAASSFRPMVVVSSDDHEILSVAKSLGVEALERPPELAADDVALDAVAHHALVAMTATAARPFDIVATVQPTSPLLRTATFDRALQRMVDEPNLDTILSAAEDTHLRWIRRDDHLVPAYERRLNRQYLPPTYRETGAFLITRRRHVTPTSRIGPSVSLEILAGPEAIDIDTADDMMLAALQIERRRVVFVVAGYTDIGLGHVHNAISLALELVRHEVMFVTPRGHELAASVLRANNFTVIEQSGPDLAEDVLALGPNVIVNDVLDTEARYVIALKRGGATVINFEDLGDGAREADLVINAIYPERQFLPNHYFGHRYFCARPEFLVAPPVQTRDEVRRVLITFGGTDPGNLTLRVLDAISGFCLGRQIAIDVVLGRGYRHPRPVPREGVEIFDSVRNISDFMRRADVVFTSAGRTVFEVALVGTPAIVLAQNERELTHLFASEANGFLNLGLGATCDHDVILTAFTDLVANPRSRQAMHDLMLQHDLRGGRERVVALLEGAIMKS